MQHTELVEKTTDDLTTQTLTDKHCENCQQPLIGAFCSRCGQEDKSTLKYFWSVILHLLDDVFSFDSRASRTIWPLIARPGFLTNEYFVGKRVHYVPPLRLYLFISIIFFISLQFFIDTDDKVALKTDVNQVMVTQVQDHLKTLIDKQVLLEQNTPKNMAKLAILQENILRFTLYLGDLNSDLSKTQNRIAIEITKELIELELEQVSYTEPLSGYKKQAIDLLLSKRLEIVNDPEIANREKVLSLGNNADGSLSFDFLSGENNKKINAYSELLANKAEKAFDSDTRPLTQQVISKLPQLMFLLLPIFALLLKVMFIFSKRLYMEHLTVALHSHSFIFFTILLMLLTDELYEMSEVSSPIVASTMAFIIKALTLWLPIYLFIMQKRVYKQGYFITVVKYSIIATIYSILIAVTGLIALIWGLTEI
ncbi:MAG: DUF3667 domain-containing protein [Colwellia sp.]|nr:DUF3667 domain-containing protein [Colwellia sp.]